VAEYEGSIFILDVSDWYPGSAKVDLGKLFSVNFFSVSQEPDLVADINNTANTIRDNITFGSSPLVSFYVNSTRGLYYLDYGGIPSVTVANPKTDQVTATISAGLNPISLQYDNSTNQLLVTDKQPGQAALTLTTVQRPARTTL
jgi:hypothetical protein